MPANSLFHPGQQFFSSTWRWYLSEGCVETIFRRPNKNAQRFWDSGTGPQKFANAQNEALAESWLLWRLRSFVSIPSPLNVRPTIAAMSCCIQCRMLMQIKLDVDIPIEPPVNGLKVKELLLQAWHGGGTAREIPPVTYEGQNQWCPGLDQCYLRFDALGSRRWFQNIADDCRRPRRSVEKSFLAVNFCFFHSSLCLGVQRLSNVSQTNFLGITTGPEDPERQEQLGRFHALAGWAAN